MRPLVMWAALVVGCQKTGVPTTPTGTTEPEHVYTANEKVAVGPAITIVGRTAAELGGDVGDEIIGWYVQLMGDVYGDGHEVLATPGPLGPIFFRSLGEAGAVPSTAHDGVIVGGIGELGAAGDVDGDGFDDVWVEGRLFRGPIEGSIDFEADWHARVEASAGNDFRGGFDADGDGWTDAVTVNTAGFGVVHYGPFLADEVRPGWFSDTVDKSQLTHVERSCYAHVITQDWVRGDLFGPGRAGVAIGNFEPIGYYCQHVVEVFDLTGPRGRHLTTADAVLADSHVEVWPAGDVDGDGAQDLTGASGVVLAPDGGEGEFRSQLADVTFDPPSYIVRAAGDMDGDGLSELIVALDNRFVPLTYSAEVWVVPSRAFRVGEPIDVVQTSVPVRIDHIPLGAQASAFEVAYRFASGDLDGDGKAELVSGDMQLDGGRVYIWRGADLFP